MNAQVAAIAVCAAVAAWCLARALIRQPKPLGARVQPYTTAHRRALGTFRAGLPAERDDHRSGVALVFGPLVRNLANALAAVVDASGSTSAERTEHERDPRPERRAAPGTADGVIYEHLAAGDVDWVRLASVIPGCNHGDARIRSLVGKPGGQAIVLAESGASAGACVAVLRAEGVDDRAIRQHMSVNITDALGGFGPLYHPDEVKEALTAPHRVKEMADELVAELLVSAGKHPAGAMHLAKTSNQPSNVINLVEERLRRRGHPSVASSANRADRGLTLIDEWSGKGGAARTGPEPTPAVTAPEPPPPPEPAA